MKVAVTGGCGFIGSHVADKLRDQNIDVRVLDNQGTPHRSDVDHVGVDIMDREALIDATRGIDVVYHLAAVADVNHVAADPTGSVALNILGTANVLEAARVNEMRRMVLASTVWVYGAARCVRGDAKSRSEVPRTSLCPRLLMALIAATCRKYPASAMHSRKYSAARY